MKLDHAIVNQIAADMAGLSHQCRKIADEDLAGAVKSKIDSAASSVKLALAAAMAAHADDQVELNSSRFPAPEDLDLIESK